MSEKVTLVAEYDNNETASLTVPDGCPYFFGYIATDGGDVSQMRFVYTLYEPGNFPKLVAGLLGSIIRKEPDADQARQFAADTVGDIMRQLANLMAVEERARAERLPWEAEGR